jgi:hypothetical protein
MLRGVQQLATGRRCPLDQVQAFTRFEEVGQTLIKVGSRFHKSGFCIDLQRLANSTKSGDKHSALLFV